jgi:phospholipid-binding lipoprotein MlaA
MTGCSYAPNSKDPYESANRKVQSFNDGVDKITLKPVAKGYKKVISSPVKKVVGNFFSNLGYPIVVVNQFLQGKVQLGTKDTARFALNSTVGLAGLLDVSTPAGLQKHDEDFGQTLAVWGVGSGPHLYVPFWGPTNVRDGVGSIMGGFAHPLGYIDDVATRNSLIALLAVDERAKLLDTESLITGDRYLFIRDAYNQHREFLIKDGKVEDTFLEGIE